ncbi:MAG: hypothetical protein WB984_04480 [Thermoplasmata archaeon]
MVADNVTLKVHTKDVAPEGAVVIVAPEDDPVVQDAAVGEINAPAYVIESVVPEANPVPVMTSLTGVVVLEVLLSVMVHVVTV